jgi:hypothetical protein
MERMARVELKPARAHKCVINTLQRWMGLLLGPCVEPTLQVKLYQFQLIMEGSESPHEPPAESQVVLVIDLIDQVEITT